MVAVGHASYIPLLVLLFHCRLRQLITSIDVCLNNRPLVYNPPSYQICQTYTCLEEMKPQIVSTSSFLQNIIPLLAILFLAKFSLFLCDAACIVDYILNECNTIAIKQFSNFIQSVVYEPKNFKVREVILVTSVCCLQLH